MNRLLDIGFEPAGHWILEQGRLALDLYKYKSQRNILYAFVGDGQVKYVGKTLRSLATRMSSYRNPERTQTTNINNQKRIMALLQKGVAVEILALPDNGLLHYGQFHLNLAAALEDDIIRQLVPEWNGGMKGAESSDERLLDKGRENDAVPVATFSFVLQPAYAKTGFFNVGVSESNLLGADGEKIEIFCGESESPIFGVINRRANSNGTPRIMGGIGL